MRIVQASGWYFPDRLGGTEIYVRALSRRLQRLGHSVQVVAPDPGGQSVREYEHDGVRVHRFPIAMPLTRDEARGRAGARGGEWFREWIGRERPDVVHFHTLVPGLEIAEVAAAKAAGARVIATTHASSLGHICARGTLMQWGEVACDGMVEIPKCAACDLQKRGLSKPVARAFARVPPALGESLGGLPGKLGTALGMTAAIAFNRTRQDALLASVDRFVLLTAAAAEIVAKNGASPGTIALNRLGVDCPGARKPGPLSQPTSTPVRVGYVGRFDPIKGVFDFARAVASLGQDVPLTFDIRGPVDTDESRGVRDQIVRMLDGLPGVTMGRALAPAEVSAHLASLDVLCCPSVCLEGGPTIAIEAQAVGTPVIGTRIGGLAELVEDGVNGRLVAPGDWPALASELRAIGADPAGTIDRWRRCLSPARTMDDVTAEYLEWYAA